MKVVRHIKECSHCGGTGKVQDDRSLGIEMRELRKAKKLTQANIALVLGVSISYLSDLEHGRRRWAPSRISAYKRAVEIFRPSV